MFKYNDSYGGALEISWESQDPAPTSLIVCGRNECGDGFYFRVLVDEIEELVVELIKQFPRYNTNLNEIEWAKTWKIRLIKMMRRLFPQYGLKEAEDMIDTYQLHLEAAADPELAEVVRLKNELNQAIARLTPDQQKKVR